MHEYHMTFDETLLTEPSRANALLACYCERQGLEAKHSYYSDFLQANIEGIKAGRVET